MKDLSQARLTPGRYLRSLVGLLPIMLAACLLPVTAEALAPVRNAAPVVDQAASAAQLVKVVEQQPVRKATTTRKTSKASSPTKAGKAQKSRKSRKTSKARQTRKRSLGDDLSIQSSAAMVIDADTGEAVASKNADVVMPIASLTKLMTGLVVMDAKQPLDEVLDIGDEDLDRWRNTHSRLRVGTQLRRDEMLLLALMSSENRAALALSRHYPGGRTAFLAQMNRKAAALGMANTHFADSAGLSNQSVSTARDLHRLVTAAHAHPMLRAYSTQVEGSVVANGRTLKYNNSNRLVRGNGDWDIELQKTGFTNEAGRCLVMYVTVMKRRLAMIFLNSNGTMTRYGDATRVRKKLEREAAATKRPASTTVMPIKVAESS